MKKILLLCVAIQLLIANSIISQDSWTQKANFGGGNRYGTLHFSIGDKGYVGTGSDDASIKSDFWEFDPSTGAWTQKADFGGGIRAYATGFSIGSKGYAGTGVVGSYAWRKDMWEYNPVSNTWRQVADFGGGLRYTAVGFGIGNKGYMGTGNYRESPSVPATYYNDFWEYDPAHNTWIAKANVPEQGRTNAVGLRIGDKGYIGTGFYYYDTRKKDFWEYDVTNDNWTRKADLPGTERFASAAFTIGNRGYVGTGAFYSNFNDFWEYNPANDNWSQKASLPGVERNTAVAFGIGNKGYMGLGGNNSGALSDLWEYTPALELICPPTQILCYSGTNNYSIPTLTVTDNNQIQSITYSINGATSRNGTGPDASGTYNTGTSTITWTVIDNSSNSSSCSTSVIVDNPVAVSIPDVYAVNPGGNANTIYIGYGPTSLILTGNGIGGYLVPGSHYTYAWSTGTSSASTSVSPNTPGTYNYSVIIKDDYGCSSSVFKTISVTDIRCGNKLDKVIVCQYPSGNPGNRHEICISANAVAAHLKNGSWLGNCNGTIITGSNKALQQQGESTNHKAIAIYPNPSRGSFTLVLSNLPATEIKVIDQQGKLMFVRKGNGTIKSQTVNINLGLIAKGMYMIQVITKEGIYSQKLEVQR